MKLLAFLLVILAASVSAAPPETVARTLFDSCVKSPINGLPTEDQMAALAPLLSEDLVKSIAAARKQRDDFQKKNPDEKPPWVEGALFSSLFEGVTSFRLGETVLDGDKATVPVYWEFTENGQTARWIDVVVLTGANDAWKVSDIYFCAPWDFRPGPSLRSVLQVKDQP